MRKKVLFDVDYTDSELIKLLLYLFVGGTAALVEWALFYIFITYVLSSLGLGLTALTMLATALAFGLSTLYHYFLGNVLVFDSGSRYKRGTELGLVFLVSIMGLGFNLLLMYIFVSLLGWLPMPSKVLTSCIVVVWNYLSRKKWIFRS
jgi:putative flippase GtrA